jgi:hypothetical protein
MPFCRSQPCIRLKHSPRVVWSVAGLQFASRGSGGVEDCTAAVFVCSEVSNNQLAIELKYCIIINIRCTNLQLIAPSSSANQAVVAT